MHARSAPAPFRRAPAFVFAAAALVLRTSRAAGVVAPRAGQCPPAPPRRTGPAAGRDERPGSPRPLSGAAPSGHRPRPRSRRRPARRCRHCRRSARRRRRPPRRPAGRPRRRGRRWSGRSGQGQQQQGGDCSPCHVFLRGSYRSGTRQDPAGPPDCVHFVLRQRPSDVRNRPRSTPARDGRLARKQRRAEKSAKPARPASRRAAFSGRWCA